MTPELPSLDRLLRDHELDGIPEDPFPNDGWSGATMTRLQRRDGDRFILKRDSLAADWIARATADGPVLREAWFAAERSALPPSIRAPYLGAGRVGDEFGILMPDLSGVLFDWERPISIEQLDVVLAALAALHEMPGARVDSGPWCPLRERVTLICRSSLERPGPARDAVAGRLLPGWDAWDRAATPAARNVIAALDADPTPLLDALAARPTALLHGDLKLANAGIAADGVVEVVDWQMVMIGAVAIELGWFLVSNVNALPLPPQTVLDRYWQRRGLAGAVEDDLAILVGLLLRGWRKGYDAEVGTTLASGVSARDDLAWWCERAVQAADRVL